MTERWRPVVGFEGIYEVSDLGNVRGLPRVRGDGRHSLRGRVLSTILNQGYPRVTMRRDGKTYYRFPWGQEVRHKNGDRANPRLDNLEYGTRADNIADCKLHGTFKNGASHLTEALVREIDARRGETAKSLAAEYRVSIPTIYGIRHRRVWAHLWTQTS